MLVVLWLALILAYVVSLAVILRLAAINPAWTKLLIRSGPGSKT